MHALMLPTSLCVLKGPSPSGRVVASIAFGGGALEGATNQEVAAFRRESGPPCPLPFFLLANFFRQEKEHKPKLLVWISSGGVGVFHVNAWGPKSSVCPSKPR